MAGASSTVRAGFCRWGSGRSGSNFFFNTLLTFLKKMILQKIFHIYHMFMVTKKNLFVMKKYVILSIILLIGLIVICGCSNKSSTQSTKPVIVTTPTLQTKFNVMEPASDGNLKITVLETKDGDRTLGKYKEFFIKIRLENLRTDQKIQVLSDDFQLISSNYDMSESYISLGLGQRKIDLQPGKSTEVTLETHIPQDIDGLLLRFDFSGPSGVGKGGKMVWFTL
jgi:hypothetical protein